MFCRIQKSLTRIPAQAAVLVHWKITHAFVVSAVEILGPRNTEFICSLGNRIEDRPVQALFFYKQFPVGPVRGIAASVKAFGPLEIGQDIVLPPTRMSHLPPKVIIARLATHIDHAIDRRTSAQNFAARVIQ